MERRAMISWKTLAIIGGILLLIIGAAVIMQRNGLQENGRTLSIFQDGQQISSCSMKQLMSMKSTKVSVQTQSVEKGKEEGDYQGVWLKEFLKQMGIQKCSTIILSAGDGYSAAASEKEMGTILIAYAVDGDTLGYYTQGGTGPMRAIFTEDIYGNRNVQYLTKINVITE